MHSDADSSHNRQHHCEPMCNSTTTLALALNAVCSMRDDALLSLSRSAQVPQHAGRHRLLASALAD